MKFIKHVRSRLLKLPIFDLHSHLGDSFQIVVKPTTFPKFNNQFIKKGLFNGYTRQVNANTKAFEEKDLSNFTLVFKLN